MRYIWLISPVLAFAALPVDAATIVQTFQVNNREMGLFTAFDSTLGVLNSVEITASGSGGAVVTRGPFGEQYYAPASGTFGVRLDSGPSENIISFSMTGLTYFAEGSTTGQCFVTGSGSAVHTEALGRFTDRPPAPLFLSGSGMSCSGLAGSISGQGTITFNYTPASAPVPEPASWAMTIAGLGFVGVALRQRKHRARHTLSLA